MASVAGSKQAQIARARTLAASGRYRTRKALADACGLHESTLRRHNIAPAAGPADARSGVPAASLSPDPAASAPRPQPGDHQHQYWPVEYFGDREHAAVLPHTAATRELFCSHCDDDTDHWRSVLLTPDDPGGCSYDRGVLTTLWVCTVCRTGFAGEA